jgi:Secretion system C-terminal sorting domain
MKKLLLSLSFIASFGVSKAQVIYSYGFPTTAALTTDGWSRTNQSDPATATLWGVPTTAPTTTFVGGAQSTPAVSFAVVNFTSVGVLTATGSTGAGPISNWLISPVVNIQNGDVVSFYSRLGQNSTSTGTEYPDRLQLRMSQTGAFTTPPSTGSEDIGSFDDVLVDINPDLTTGIYPRIWTKYSYTVAGLAGPTDVKFGFRYYVLDGGNEGANSNVIGIDTFAVNRTPLATDAFFTSNFSVSPNPAKDVLNFSNRNNTIISNIALTDVNGRVVKQINNSVSQINISELTSGVYFLKITSDKGIGTTKIVKQ